MKKYGMPYQGSKSRIADWVISILPEADCLVDAFGGGGAITHCASESGKYKKIIYNEIKKPIAYAFKNALCGLYKDRRFCELISREEFNRVKGHDGFRALQCSFGNNGVAYDCNKQMEKVLIPVIKMLNCEDRQGRIREYKTFIDSLFETIEQHPESLRKASLTRIRQFSFWERTNELSKIQHKDKIDILSCDYQDIPIPDGAVIYCDIPYRFASNQYGYPFDYERFYEWAEKQDNIFISEYYMPDNFVCISSKEKVVTISHWQEDGTRKATEKIFIPKRNYEKWKNTKNN